MKSAKFEALMNGNTAIARKVYGAVPAQDPWAVPQIYAELIRSGTTTDRRIVEECLDSLKSKGLIRETSPGHFIRTRVIKRKPTMTLKSVDTTAQPGDKPAAKESPIDLLARLAERARDIEQRAADLGKEIEAAAIAIDDALATRDAENAKLRQLKALLKELG